jgi:hypothetical protein
VMAAEPNDAAAPVNADSVPDIGPHGVGRG